LGAALNVVAAPPVTNNMALILAGPFTMGDSFNDGNSSELPLHKIYVQCLLHGSLHCHKSAVGQCLSLGRQSRLQF